MKRNMLLVLVVAALTFIELAAPVYAEQVRLHGSGTVVESLVNPYKDAVEKATGNKLEIVGNGTGKGLVDLVEGRADASLSSASLDEALAAAKVAGKSIEKSKVQFIEVSRDELVFIVHPANPVSSLTRAQIRDIHTGKIKNWKEVGGKDMPISVFIENVTGGTRALINKEVMGGEEIGKSAIPLASAKKVGDMVAADAGGFGGLGKGLVEARKVKIVQTEKLGRPLGFITIGAPSEKVKKVIEAYKAEVKKKGK